MARRSRARAALHAALQELEAGRQAEAIRHLITATWNLSRAEDSKPQKPSAPSPRESEPEVSPGDPAVDGGHRWETHTSPSGITEPCCVRCALAERAYRSGLDTKPCLMRANWNGWAPSPLREPEATTAPDDRDDRCPRCHGLLRAGDDPSLVTCEKCGRRWTPLIGPVYAPARFAVAPAPLREPEATTACPTCGCTESDVRGVNLKCRNCERIFAPAPLATEGKGEETPAPGSDARRLPAGTLVTCETCPMPHPKDDDGRLCRFPKVAAPASRETGREG